MKVALVCIAKNEDHYIDEWIQYNKKLGFDKIFIYQNNWRTKVTDEIVHKIEFDGECQQIPAYNHFIQTYKNDYDWAAFFDVDEFLVLKKHSDIHSFIDDYKLYNAIGINWVLFGDNGVKTFNVENSSLLSRFTKRQIGLNQHVKAIINIKLPNINMAVHNSNYSFINPNNNQIFSGALSLCDKDDVCQINHYFCKTFDEFIAKCNRGRSDLPVKRKLDEFHEHNTNNIEDLTALNFFNFVDK